MQNKLLFPQQFRKAGLAMVLIGLLGIWTATSNGLINVYRMIAPAETMPDGGYPYPANFWQINQVFAYLSVGSVMCGLLFFLFSKEKDEFFYHVRLESLQFASMTQIGLTFCACIYAFFSRTEGMENILPAFVTLSVACFWVLYFLRYGYMGYFKSRIRSGREQTR